MRIDEARVVFMGTPELAEKVLEKQLSAGFNVVAAVTQTDKPKGRGGHVAMSPVKELCLEKNIPVLQPASAKSDDFFEELSSFGPDIITVAAYGKILPKRVLELPAYGCINVHASLLPKYRGAAPIQWPILNGDSETGVTIMYMDEGCDTGDIITSERIPIADDETGGSLHDKLAGLGADLLVRTVPDILSGKAERTPQDHEKSSYVGLIGKELGKLDFSKPAKELERYVRGLDPWPGTYTFLDGKLLKIKQAEAVEGVTDRPAGSCFEQDRALMFATSEGLLRVLVLQPEGRKAMTSKEFLNGMKGRLE